MSDVLVEGRRLGRTYRYGRIEITALTDVDVTVRAGDRIAVVGPSGGGKSTLLQLMGGLDVPTAGRISWPALGERSSLRPRRIGYVFQTESLLTPLSVLENVELPLLLAGESRTAARTRAREVLERLDMESILGKLPEELSGGQAQRVAVARAFAARPRLILADEPTGRLDHPTAHRLFDIVLGALAAGDTALVVATHDMAIAGRLPVRLRLSHGRLEAI
jgi:ABC-type lipoprotein export system ATPase subunit